MHYHNIPGLVVSVTSTCRADNAGSNRFRAKRYNKVGQHRPSQSFACLLEVFYPLGIRSVIGQKCETVSPKNPMMMDGVVATSVHSFFFNRIITDSITPCISCLWRRLSQQNGGKRSPVEVYSD